MLDSAEYLRRAAQMDERAKKAHDPTARAEFSKAAEAWRELARRARLRQEGEPH